MTARKLPPLLVGGCYRCPALDGMEFTAPDLLRELRGEATAMLHLQFANKTALEVPARAFQLQMLMASLMRAFPQQALANLRLFEDTANQDGPGHAHGGRKN